MTTSTIGFARLETDQHRRDDPFGGKALCKGLRRLNWMHFANDGYQAALLWTMPVIAVSAGMTSARWGLIAAIHMLLGVLLAIPAGMAARRWGGIRVLSAAMALYGTAFLILAFSRSQAALWVSMIVAGVGFGVFHPIGFGMAARIAEKKDDSLRTASAIGNFAAIGDIGRVIIGCGIGAVCVLIGFEWSMALASVLAMVLAMIVLARTRSGKNLYGPAEAHPEKGSRPGAIAECHRLLQNRSFRNATAIGVCDALSTTGLILFVPLILGGKGYMSGVLAMFVALLYGGSLLGKVVMGSFSDRWGHRTSLLACQAILTVTVAIFVLTHSVLLDTVLVFALGMLTKGCLPISLAMTAKALQGADCELGFGIHQTASGLAAALSPALLGLLSVVAGTACAACLLASMSLGAIGVIVILDSHRSSCRRSESCPFHSK